MLQWFSVTFSLFFTILIINYAQNWRGLLNISDVIFLSIIASLFITGLHAWNHYGEKGIMTTRTLFKRYALASMVMSVFATAPITYIGATEPPVPSVYTLLVGTVFVYLAMILAFFLILLVFTSIGFGIVGIVSIFQRRFTGELLAKVREITPNIMESSTIPRNKSGAEHTLLRWLFDIPPSLDSRTLKIDPISSRESFPWKIFGSALMWMIFFSVVLAIYVSLNPFFLGMSDFQTLFSVSSSLSLVIPVFIIPWFIYVRLNARIEGPIQDFKLFDGIKSRMVGTLVAFGTLIVFIRFALRDIDAFLILGNFAIYTAFFVLAAFIFTFVYFNYFEDDLATAVEGDFRDQIGEPI